MRIKRNVLLATLLLSLLSVTGKAVNFDHQWQNSLPANKASFFGGGFFRAGYFIADKKDWILGTWEGTAFQVDAQTTWTIKFAAQKDKYTIEYPSLHCGGDWTAIKVGKKKATFRETLTFGQDKCVDGGQAIIEKISDTQISFKFVDPGSPNVNSTAVLNRKTTSE